MAVPWRRLAVQTIVVAVESFNGHDQQHEQYANEMNVRVSRMKESNATADVLRRAVVQMNVAKKSCDHE